MKTAIATDATPSDRLKKVSAAPGRRPRMSAAMRRDQLMDVARTVFAERGYDAASIEEIAHRAGVSKPVVYGHFQNKEGLYAAVVSRESDRLLDMLAAALTHDHPRDVLYEATTAFLAYVESCADGFRILLRGSGAGNSASMLTMLLDDVAARAEVLLANAFELRGYRTSLAPMYAQMLLGMVAFTGQWWLDTRETDRGSLVAHFVNLAWNGLSHLDVDPTKP